MKKEDWKPTKTKMKKELKKTNLEKEK